MLLSCTLEPSQVIYPCLFLIAGKGPVCRSNALAQERGGELVGVCVCMRDVLGEEG